MRKAVTLVEVLVTSVIMGFALAGTATVLPMATRMSEQAINRARLATYAADILKSITTDIRIGAVVNMTSRREIVIRDQGTNGSPQPILCQYDNSTKSILKKLDKNDQELNRFRAIAFDSTKVNCRFYNYVDTTSTFGNPTSVKVVVQVTAYDSKKKRTLTTEVSNIVNCRNLSNLL